MGISKIKKNRKEKLEKLKREGVSPYPAKTSRTNFIKEALEGFEGLSEAKKRVTLVGRIYSIRSHGGSTFIHFGDGTGKIQAYFKKDKIGPKLYQSFLDDFDMGDFIEVTGILFKTRTEEKTVEVDKFKMLSKSFLPLPEKWHGLKDSEERFRKRYLDLIFNEDIKEKFKTRSEVIKEIRFFLDKNGFLEVETPILTLNYGGAKAEPFKTHLNAMDLDLYLRISLELYLKRLIVGGFEKVYEIGKCFRNEGIDRSHNPDFTMLEFYWAYADYKDLMKFTEEMFKHIVEKVNGSLKLKYEGKEIDFSTPWKRIEFSSLLKKETGIDIDEIHITALRKEAKKLGVKLEKGEDKTEIADKIYKKTCRPKIWQPTFLIHHPVGFFPLAKSFEDNPKKLANFQLIVANWELVNAFSELNDPIEQRKRFKEQEEMYKKGFKEAQRMDKEFLEALEHGMPPAAGFGMGIDRVVALLAGFYSLREAIFFPLMKPKD